MINILCYGDSNTWGDPPTPGTPRFDRSVRWPGVLQALLGNEYYVIEEGLGGRTTDLDDKGILRNGLAYLPACIQSHRPLDWVFIMLGTNDLKARFGRDAKQIAQAVGRLVDCTRENVAYQNGEDNEGRKLTICIMSPAQVNMAVVARDDITDADKKIAELAVRLNELAEAKDCAYINIAPFTETGEDGVHLTAQSHHALAETVKKMLNSKA